MTATGRVDGDGDVERRVEDRLHLEAGEGAGSCAGQCVGVAVPFRPRQVVDPSPQVGVLDDEEVPRLGVADAGRLVGGLQQPGEYLVPDRVGPKAHVDVPAFTDGPVDRPAVRVVVGVVGKRLGLLVGLVGPLSP